MTMNVFAGPVIIPQGMGHFKCKALGNPDLWHYLLNACALADAINNAAQVFVLEEIKGVLTFPL
jgi:hypothetical protein